MGSHILSKKSPSCWNGHQRRGPHRIKSLPISCFSQTRAFLVTFSIPSKSRCGPKTAQKNEYADLDAPRNGLEALKSWSREGPKKHIELGLIFDWFLMDFGTHFSSLFGTFLICAAVQLLGCILCNVSSFFCCLLALTHLQRHVFYCMNTVVCVDAPFRRRCIYSNSLPRKSADVWDDF